MNPGPDTRVTPNSNPDPDSSGLLKPIPHPNFFTLRYGFNPARIIQIRPGPGYFAIPNFNLGAKLIQNIWRIGICPI